MHRFTLSALCLLLIGTVLAPQALGQQVWTSLIYTSKAAIHCPAVVTEDVDGDGAKDLLFISLDGTLHLIRHDGSPLPGWPVPAPASELATAIEFNRLVRCAPAIADLDGDGVNEIIAFGTHYIHVFNADGTQRWEHATGTATQGTSILPPPVVADLNGDGSKEILYVGVSSGLDVISATGEPVRPGWPKRYSMSYSAPAVADLDGDGDLEIVHNHVISVSDTSQVEHAVWHHNGSLLNDGWPKSYATSYSFTDVAPIVTDLDNDGAFEIIVPTYEDVYIYDINGNLRDGWPHSVGRLAYLTVGDLNADRTLEVGFGWVAVRAYLYKHKGTLLWEKSCCYGLYTPSPAIGDIDGDGRADYLLADGFFLVSPQKSWLHAYRHDSSTLDSFPVEFNEFLRSGVSIGDIDGNGKVDMVVAFKNGDIHFREYDAVYDAKTMFWPQYRHDPAHTGFAPGYFLFRSTFESGDLSQWQVFP